MSTVRPILIVEDDDAVRQMLVEHVAATGEFQSVEASTLNEASQYLDAADARFDSIILDINLPDGDGRDFCAKMRRQGHRMPIIMLTGATTEADVVLGLDSGANDYVSKPFRASELLARLNAQLRTYDSSEDAVFTIGPYTFKPASKLLIRADKNQKIRLTGKEVAILKYLYRAGDRVTSRQVLLNEVWGYNAGVTTHTLETHFYRLRQKIEVDSNDFCILLTVPGGYRLNAGATVGEGTTAGRPLTS